MSVWHTTHHSKFMKYFLLNIELFCVNKLNFLLLVYVVRAYHLCLPISHFVFSQFGVRALYVYKLCSNVQREHCKSAGTQAIVIPFTANCTMCNSI